MIETKGDLVQMAEEGKFDIIVHGANCFCTMGSGIAGQLAGKYPQVLQEDKKTLPGDRTKLGSFTLTQVTSPQGNPFIVMNAYTQYHFGGNTDLFEYEALEYFLDTLASLVTTNTAQAYGQDCVPLQIGFPMIGAGLARGDWPRIKSMLKDFSEKVSPECSVTIVEYDPNRKVR
jgi:O-acetyl-ADP-ribose deacetylase (regulator of RNase III)